MGSSVEYLFAANIRLSLYDLRRKRALFEFGPNKSQFIGCAKRSEDVAAAYISPLQYQPYSRMVSGAAIGHRRRLLG